MNREILFRGKRFDNSEWAYGVPVSDENIVRIAEIKSIDEITEFLVDPETVGQFTGMRDKYGRKIFEGDVLKLGNHKYVVKWNDDCAMFVLPCITDEALESDFTLRYGYEFEVIGNVFDNPERR